MNDLSGLSWNASAPSNASSQPTRNGDIYASLRPSSQNTSRQPSPLSSAARRTPIANSNAAPKPPGQDSFAGLLGTSKKITTVSLQERQKQLLEEKKGQAGQQDPFNTNDAAFWEGLGSGRNTPADTAAVTSSITGVCLSCLETFSGPLG